MAKAREQVDAGGVTLEDILEHLLLNFYILNNLVRKQKKVSVFKELEISTIRFVRKHSLRLMYAAVMLTQPENKTLQRVIVAELLAGIDLS
jgi:hypothetical protein